MNKKPAALRDSIDEVGILIFRFCPFCNRFFPEKLEAEEHDKKCPFRSVTMYRIGNKFLFETKSNSPNYKFDDFFFTVNKCICFTESLEGIILPHS